ncbi:hypothetical protein ABIG06_004455 [Bradyrhizobium sp. USDA 326]
MTQRHRSSSWYLACRHAFASSRRVSPELCLVTPPSRSRGHREDRVPTGTRGPLRKRCTQKTAQQHTGGADHSAFPARWSDGLCRALLGAEFVLASLVLAKFTGAAPVDATAASARSLTVATTARTTRFCRTHGSLDPIGSDDVVHVAIEDRRDEPVSAARPHAVPGSRRAIRPALHLSCTTLPRPPQARLANMTTTRSPLKDEPGWATHTTNPNFGKVGIFSCERIDTGAKHRISRRHSGAPQSGEPGIHLTACTAARWILRCAIAHHSSMLRIATE